MKAVSYIGIPIEMMVSEFLIRECVSVILRLREPHKTMLRRRAWFRQFPHLPECFLIDGFIEVDSAPVLNILEDRELTLRGWIMCMRNMMCPLVQNEIITPSR
jgi:hypothetical protein